MKKQFVTYKIALALHNLGFNEDCLCYYKVTVNTKPKLLLVDNDLINFRTVTEPSIKAPLWGQVIDWFKSNYNLYIWINTTPWLNSYSFNYNFNDNIFNSTIKYANHEKCRKCSILKAIEIVSDINNKTKIAPIDEAIKYIQENYCDVHLNTSYMLLGNVVKLIEMLTGIKVDVNELEKYKKA